MKNVSWCILRYAIVHKQYGGTKWIWFKKLRFFTDRTGKKVHYIHAEGDL